VQTSQISCMSLRRNKGSFPETLNYSKSEDLSLLLRSAAVQSETFIYLQSVLRALMQGTEQRA
jgi:hypothetical protein